MKVVFSDLDGTLLDFYTYSYEDALPGIEIIKNNDAVFVPVSSKTRLEMMGLVRELGLVTPLIFENGSGIAFPDKDKTDDYSLDFIGLNSDELEIKFQVLKEVVNIDVRSLFEMDINEIIQRTGLSNKGAGLAKERVASIPFVPLNEVLENM